MSTDQPAGLAPTSGHPPPPPANLSFIFQVKVARALGYSSAPDSTRMKPLLSSDQFELRDGDPSYFRWTFAEGQPQITRLQAQPTWLVPYGRPVSVYIQGDPQSGANEEYRVLGTIGDVTATAQRSDPYIGWRYVQFDYIDYNPNKDASSALYTPYYNVRNMSYMCLYAEHPKLAAPGSPAWMPEVLPETYDYRPKAGVPIPSSGGICGNIALILALIVSSCPSYLAEWVLTTRLGWGSYAAHGVQTSRTADDDRVVIVTVFLDVACAYAFMDTTQEPYFQELKKLERGLYGPMLR